MDQQQYEKLKEYIEALIDEKLDRHKTYNDEFKSIYRIKIEKELDALMGIYSERDW